MIGPWTNTVIPLVNRPMLDGPAGGRCPRRGKPDQERPRWYGRSGVLHANHGRGVPLRLGLLTPLWNARTGPTADTGDGTIRRYDNAHEDSKGHELHVAPKPETEQIDFPGMAALWQRLWNEIPEPELDIE